MRAARRGAEAVLGTTLVVSQGACSRGTKESLSSTATKTSGGAAPVSRDDPDVTRFAQPETSPSPVCGDSERVFLFSSPEHPTRQQPLRILAVPAWRLGASLSLAVRRTAN